MHPRRRQLILWARCTSKVRSGDCAEATQEPVCKESDEEFIEGDSEGLSSSRPTISKLSMKETRTVG